ncbi:MAG TPA: hypothetical protein VIY47_15795, partial [Ignavibacteriaceae bacterium]
ITFQSIRNILFEGFCFHRAQEHTGVSWDEIDTAKLVSKEMLDDPQDQLLSVIKFILGYSINKNKERGNRSLNLDSMGFGDS